MGLIKDRKLARDPWQLLDAGADHAPSSSAVIVPLALWRSQREVLLERDAPLGVWLAGEDDPAEIAPDLGHFQVVAVRFGSLADGRGYSTAHLLRVRYGWGGELRAIGDIQRDQLSHLARCGFDAFALHDGADVEGTLAAFEAFSETYQASADQPIPLFRRRASTPSSV